MNLADTSPREKAMQSQIMLVHRANQRLSEENADLKLQVAELLLACKAIVERGVDFGKDACFFCNENLPDHLEDCQFRQVEAAIAKAEDDQ